MWRVVTILFLGAVIGVIGTLAYRLKWGSDSALAPSTSGDPASQSATQPPPRRSIIALGTVEPSGGIVHVSSPLMGFRIQAVHVREGQHVEQGTLVVELDSSAANAELRLAQAQQADAIERQQAEIRLAQERVASAELALSQLLVGRELEQASVQSRIDVALLKREQAKNDLASVGALRKLKEPLASEQQVRHQQVVVEAVTADHAAAVAARRQLEQSLIFREQTAQAELRAARQSLELAKKGTGLESLKQGVRLAELKLEQTRITSPLAGTVLSVAAHPGEVIAQQPLLQVANLDSLVCVAEVDAADVAQLRIGQKATIQGRALGHTEFAGTLDRVGSSASPAMLRPLDPRQPVDRTVAKAVVAIASPPDAGRSGTGDRRAALVGLQVEVEFLLPKTQ